MGKTTVTYKFLDNEKGISPKELDREGNLYNLYSIQSLNIPAGEKMDVRTGILLDVPRTVEVSFEEALHPILGVYVRNSFIYNKSETESLPTELIVSLKNKSDKTFKVKEGMNIAKIRFSPLKNPILQRVQ